MDGTRDYHTKWSKSDKDKYCMISLISAIQKVMLTNLCAKQKQTHRHRDQTCRCPGRGGGWGREGWEFGISRCKLVYIPILRDGPAYSTGSDIQHPLINHNGKHKWMPIWPNHSSAQHKLTQPWKSTTRQLEEKIHIMLASSCHHLTQNASVTFHSTSNKAPSTSLTLQSPVCGPASSSCLPLHSPLLPDNPTDFRVPQTGQSGSWVWAFAGPLLLTALLILSSQGCILPGFRLQVGCHVPREAPGWPLQCASVLIPLSSVTLSFCMFSWEFCLQTVMVHLLLF